MPSSDHPGAGSALSRRRFLSRLAGCGLIAAIGATATACSGSGGATMPQKLLKDFLGQAQQATGSAPAPRLLIWITPIVSLRPPVVDLTTPLAGAAATATPRPTPTPGLATIQALGWDAMLAPWQDRNPSITLVHQVVAAEKLTSQEIAAARSEDPCDVAYTDSGYLLGNAKVLDPLDVSMLSRKIAPVAFEPHSALDQIYAMPIFLSALALFVNNQRLKDKGIDPNTPLRDWSSFETTARALTDRATSRFGIDVFGSGSPHGGEMRYAPFLWSAGGSFFNNAGDRALWNERSGLDALIYLARLSQNYASPSSAVADDGTLIRNWLGGQTATLLAGPELTADADARRLDYGIQSVPAFIQGQASSLVMSAGAIGVFAKSKHKDWGLDFARYLASKEAQVAGLTQLRLLPANLDAGDAAPVFQKNLKLAQFLRILREDDVHSFPMPRSHEAEVSEIIRAYLGVALQGLATPKVAWDKSAAEATALLKAVPTPKPTLSLSPTVAP